ncbi:MAG: CCA tRNA nucleotidyltransferase [Candidatus Poseidonia sp.]|nr:CCA tRNA nucleotidyltransferase [Poseidonia sp.]
MMEGPTLTKGLPADLEGEPCPPQLIRWLATLDNDILSLLETIAKDGEGAWLVGGCVRDAWLGTPSTDVDFCTTCTPDRLLTLFGDRAIPTGVDFGTVTIKGDNGHFEVTTLRTESLYRDGRRPERVEWGTSLKEDLSRRDFTFNSMAVDVARQLLYDPYNGLSDLGSRTVRAVGDAGLRCEEDALRILRAYRFMRRDEGPLWTMEPSLHSAINKHRSRLNMVTVERRWMELQKILAVPRPGEVLEHMQNDGVLPFVFTNLRVLNPVLFHLLDQPALVPLALNQRLAFLMCEHETKDAVAQLQALRTSKELQRTTAMFHEQLGFLPEARKASLRVFNHVMGTTAEHHLTAHETMAGYNINLHTGLQTSKESVHEVRRLWEQIERTNETQPCLVDGHWIMARTGAVEGMRLGRLKQWLHRIQIEEGLTTLSEMEAALTKLSYEHGDVEAWPRPVFP